MPAVAPTVARPDELVIALVAPSTAVAPEAGAANVTTTPGTGWLAESRTSATRFASAVFTVALCGEPLETVIEAGTPMFERAKAATGVTPRDRAGDLVAARGRVRGRGDLGRARGIRRGRRGREGRARTTRGARVRDGRARNRVPLLSATSTVSGDANAVEIVADCEPPMRTVVVAGAPANVAVTLCAPAIVTEQVVDVPEHAPPQPTNVAPATGDAVRLTCEPSRKSADADVHIEPQLIAAGVEEIVPTVAVPSFETLSVRSVPIVSLSTAELLVESGSEMPPLVATEAVLTTEPEPEPLMMEACTV